MFRRTRKKPAPSPRQSRPARPPRLGLERLEEREAPAAGPRILAHTPSPTAKPHAPSQIFQVQFDQVMDATSFAAADVSFTGPNGAIAVSNVAPTVGGGNRVFDITYAPQGTAGAYSFTVGPDVRDTTGRLMDQNNNNIAGEDPGDRYNGTFQLYGPRVNFRISGASASAPPGTIDQVLIQFGPSTPGINGATFTPSDVVSFTGPNGPIAVTGVTPNPNRPTFEFYFNFAPQGTAGTYHFSVGSDISDTFGNLLDQDQDGIGGEAPGDYFNSSFAVDPFVASGVTPTGTPAGPVGTFRMGFSKPVNLTTLDASDLAFTGPGGPIAIAGITPVAGSLDRQFDVTFAPQTAIGSYTVTIGPNVSDVYGNGMDQDRDGIPFEVPADRLVSTFSIVAPRIASGLSGTLRPPVSTGTVSFTQAMDPATFTPEDIVLTGPNGVVPVTSVAPVAGSNNQSFLVTFPTQGKFGRYDWVIGPDIRNTAGNAIDQNNNGITGEIPGDQFTSFFFIGAPRITGVTPGNNGTFLGPVSKITLTFDQDIDGTTFAPGDVVEFTGPNGAIPVTAVTQTGARTFDVTFDPQNADGRYTFVVGPNIADPFGNPMNQDNDLIPGEDPGDRFTTSFNLNQFGPDAFGYVARPHTFEAIDLESGQAGVFTILDNIDDAAAAVDLGANAFNFYGLVYSGNNELFVNTNGMITFGSPSNQFNSNFPNKTQPVPFQQLANQPYIAAFYRDWTTTNSPQPTGAVLGKFEDTNADGTPDRLIVEWSNVRNFISLAQNTSVTFQAILDLNTGANASGVTLNYVQTQTQDPGVDNGNIVGIRPSGGFPNPSVLISPTNQFGPFGFPPSPWVGPGKAMQFTAPPIGGTVRGTKFDDRDRDGVRDSGEPGLAGWQMYLDENGNAARDAGEPTVLTDADGNYEFTGVVPGAHVVREVEQAGWVRSRPGVGGTVVNGGFETGDFTGWSTIGVAQNVGHHGVIPPAEGTRQVFVYSGSAFGIPTAPTATLESFLGVAAGTLSAIAGVNVVQGAALKQTVFATAGRSLTIAYNFLTGENPIQLRDLAFVTVAGGGGAVVTNNVRQLTGSEPSSFFFMQSGYETFAYTFPTTGVYTIGIGVVDGVSSSFPSGLMLDDVRLLGEAYPVGVLARQAIAGKDFGNYRLPVAAGDSYDVDEDGTLSVAAPGVLGNDTTYLPGGSLAAVLVDGPTHGELTFAADGSFEYVPDANFSGSDSFAYRVGDGVDGNVATVSILVNPVADAPFLSIEPAEGDENAPIDIIVDAAPTDLDGSEALTVRIDGVPAAAVLSAGTDLGGGSWLLTPADLPGLTLTKLDGGTFALTVTAIATEAANGDTATTSATLDVTANNLAPVASIVGPSGGVRGQGRTFTLGATDPSPTDQAAGFTYAIDWDGNGTVDQTVTGADGLRIEHTYTTTGDYTVRVVAIDKDGGTSAEATHGVSIAVVALQPDPGDPTKTALVVGGTINGDAIAVVRAGEGTVRAIVNGVAYGPFAPTGHVIVHAQAGNDFVLVNGNVPLPAMLFGGDGIDVMSGGNAGSVLVGGAGSDVLTGGTSRDIVVGGLGSDVLMGGGGDDLLIAGFTAHDDDEAALAAVESEWFRADRTYEERVLALRDGGGLNGAVRLDASTVFDDGALDVVMGGAGRDWYFASLTGDLLLDRAGDEFAN